MASKNNIFKRIAAHWRMALILFGVVLTVAWIILLVWLPLRLLDLDKFL